MKHVRNFLLILLMASMMVFSSCATTPRQTEATIQIQDVKTEIALVDSYGNLNLVMSEQQILDRGFSKGDLVGITVGSFNFTAPIAGAYGDVDKGNYVLRLDEGKAILAINYGNLGATSGAIQGDRVTISMIQQGGYLEEFELRRLERTDIRSDYASDAVFANFRMVNLGSIKTGMLYRSANPILADARAPYVAVLTEQAKIKTVINLADSEESLYNHLASVPYYKALVGAGRVIALDMGVTFTDQDFLEKLRKGLVFMSQHEGPYLIHCNEGKDRAGFVSALLSALMGASVDEIVEDYMMSYENYYGVEKGTERYERISNIILSLFADINGGKPVTDRNIKRVAQTYLTNKVGLTSSQLSSIKSNLGGIQVKLSGQFIFTF